MHALTAFNFQRWIDDHRHLLRPPVCNKQVFEDSEFMIMVVGGPNARKDYHDDPGEEFCYELEGDMLLPAHVSHSPQRFAGTVGLAVVCERCEAQLYAEYLPVTNIETDLPPVFERFWGDPEHSTCRSCGTDLRK